MVDNRLKTDVRLTETVLKDVEFISRHLGISKNAFYVVSISLGVAIAKVIILGDKRDLYQISVGIFDSLVKRIS